MATKSLCTADNAFALALINGDVETELNTGPFKLFATKDKEGLSILNIYSWKENCWKIFNELEGSRLVRKWLRLHPAFEDRLNDKSLKSIWSFAVGELLEAVVAIVSYDEDPDCLKKVVLPTTSHYLHFRNNRLEVELPNKDLNLRYSINNVLNKDKFVNHENDVKEYVPSTFSENNYFNNYIKTAFPDEGVAEVVQEFVGAAFFKTSFNRCLWICGEPGSGKSTILKCLEKITESYAAADFNKLQGTFDLANLVDATIIGVSEVEMIDGKSMPEGLLKTIMSGDKFPINDKYKKIVSASILGKWFVCSNDIPHINDKSGGFFRRFVWIYIRSKIEEKLKIHKYEDKIVGEDMECFFDWALIGALRVVARGKMLEDCDLPESLRTIKKELRYKNNSIAQWVDEKGVQITSSTNHRHSKCLDVYKSYDDFCSENGLPKIGNERFWSIMKSWMISGKKQQYDRTRKNSGWYINLEFVKPADNAPSNFFPD